MRPLLSLSLRLFSLSSGKVSLLLSKHYLTSRPLCALPPSILTELFTGQTPRSVRALDKTSNRKEFQRAISFEPTPCLRQDLLCKVAEHTRDGLDKVSIVGAGMVGVACVNAILFQKISSHVAMVDAFPRKLEGEGLDYCHGLAFLNDPHVEYDTDFCVTSNSKVVIVATGARQKKGETKLNLVNRNTGILKNILPPLVRYSPKAVFIIVSNPVDILTWVAWKVSGIPIHRIIGSGCHLDTARWRYLIGDRIGVATSSVHGFIVGEHGDTQVPLWSSVNISGVLLRDILPNIGLETDEEKWHELAKDVIRASSTVRCLKGYSNTAVGLSVAELTRDILRNSQRVRSVSTFVQGHHDIAHDIFLSLPCTLGENGISQVIRLRMTDYEKKQLQSSADFVYGCRKNIKV